MDIHKRENLDIAFRFLSNVEKVPLVNIGKTLISNAVQQAKCIVP